MAFQKQTRLGFFFFIIGNLLFSILGLVIGYFLLVQFRPDLNFLGLNIPMVKDMEIPEMPEGWPSYDWDPSKPYAPEHIPPRSAVVPSDA